MSGGPPVTFLYPLCNGMAYESAEGCLKEKYPGSLGRKAFIGRAERRLLGGQKGVERAWKQDPKEAAESGEAGV